MGLSDDAERQGGTLAQWGRGAPWLSGSGGARGGLSGLRKWDIT